MSCDDDDAYTAVEDTFVDPMAPALAVKLEAVRFKNLDELAEGHTRYCVRQRLEHNRTEYRTIKMRIEREPSREVWN